MGASATILVVDDNAENRALAQATLEDEGYTVVLATNGEEAVAAFAAALPDCVLLDVRMPGLDGPGACAKMRVLPGGADVPILFLTALRDVETFDRAILAGGDDFLTKPVRPTELVTRVQAALKLRRFAAERTELYAQVKQQRDALLRLQLQKEQLVAFLVHDLKNPVNAIALHAELLLRDRDGTVKAKRAAEKIRDDGRALMRMITTLLDIAKADEGQLVPALARVDTYEMLAEVAAELEVRAESKQIKFVLASDAPATRADPDLLRRVLENLVENAIRFAPEDSEIRLSARAADGGVELAVHDDGPGIPAAERERIFERFAQASGPTRTNRGLGLAFCKLAIEAHGGRIWIDEHQPGTTFCVHVAASD